jgi:putative SOS response-associated peptidase YedK
MPMPAAVDLPLPDLDFGDGHGPGRLGVVVRVNPRTGQRHLDELVWGLLPHNTADPATAPRPIHARAETVADTPLFADAFRRRRAIVPVDTYYQRKTGAGTEARYAVSRADGRPMAWAGLWESYQWPGGEIERTYCVITVAANALLSPIHDRMPVVLEEADWPLWLGEVPGDPLALLVPPAKSILRVRPMRRA